MAISRRRLIKRGLSGGLLIAAGGVGLSLQGSLLRQPRGPLKVLDALEFSVLSAVADRLTPASDEAPAASVLGVPELVDDTLAAMHPVDVADVKKMLRTLESATLGLLLDLRPTPFTAASPDAQDATLRGWRDSRITVRRSGYKALHKMCTSAYWGIPETFPLSGYPGPPNFSRGKR
ncbi:MAG: gluconate 2-dehydrogenase subunit 3 family protein [Myxococcota bacterium]|nr:gluconate 2-dehydrogenase subunit 3 family protein [Myxococcota bacterium]